MNILLTVSAFLLPLLAFTTVVTIYFAVQKESMLLYYVSLILTILLVIIAAVQPFLWEELGWINLNETVNTTMIP